MGVIHVWILIADIASAINRLCSKKVVPGKHLFPPPPSCLPV